ncbi:hypothetical protein N9955_00790 [bacterium]|nr:hypothetical protein [bacterium]
MNDFGNLAYQIVKYEFRDDVSRFPISYVSGWLETNIGELNGLLHEDFYIDESGNIGPCGLAPVEKNIFAHLYTINYYDKASREALRGFIWTDASGAIDDWTSIKEGDSSVQRVSKNSIARSFNEFSKDTRERMDNLIYQYNSTKASPLQVAGLDGSYSIPYTNDDFNRT